MSLPCRHRLLGPVCAVLAAGALAALAACFLAQPACAHEYWLAPDRWAPARGAAVQIGAYVGTGFRGERKPYRSERCVRFMAQAARALDLAAVARNGDFTWARFAPADGGGAMLAYESSFATIELSPSEFDAYLALEGLEGPLAARRVSGAVVLGRERYRRCAKAWLDGSDLARATKPIGMSLEIVPLARPGAEPQLRAQVMFHGHPLAGVLVRAWRSPWGPDDLSLEPGTRDSIGALWEVRTDARGVVSVPTTEPGEWLVSAVHMVPCREPATADWESFWASLTFARAPRRAPRDEVIGASKVVPGAR